MSGVRFIVTAMPSRANVVDYLLRHIPGLVVVWDRGLGAPDTFRRAWRLHQDEPTIRIQDDIVLTRNFVGKALAAISGRSGSLVKMFSRYRDDVTKGSRWMPGSSWMMNQCYYLPPGAAASLTAYSDAWGGWEANPGGDDLLMAEWLASTRTRYWLHCPSLLEHLSLVSTLDPRRSKHRQSTTFCDPEPMEAA